MKLFIWCTPKLYFVLITPSNLFIPPLRTTFLSTSPIVNTHARQLTKVVMMWISTWINNSHLDKLKWQKINIIFQLLFRSSSISTTNHRISSSHLSFQCKTNSSLEPPFRCKTTRFLPAHITLHLLSPCSIS